MVILHRYLFRHNAAVVSASSRSRPSARSALARSSVRAASASSAPERRASATRCSAVAAASSVALRCFSSVRRTLRRLHAPLHN